MEFEFEFESAAGVAIGVARGFITLEEMKDAGLTMWRQVDGPIVRIL